MYMVSIMLYYIFNFDNILLKFYKTLKKMRQKKITINNNFKILSK